MDKQIFKLGVFQQLDTLYEIEAYTEEEARKILLENIENGDISIIDDPRVETHVALVDYEEGAF